MTNGRLEFTTPMINFSNGKELLNAKPEELENLGIIQPIQPIRNEEVSAYQKAMIEYDKKLDENRDNISKYTCGDAMNQLFDFVDMTGNTNFAAYADVLKEIRLAKARHDTFVEITEDEIQKLLKIFKNPPKNTAHNRQVAFVLECLNVTLAIMKNPSAQT